MIVGAAVCPGAPFLVPGVAEPLAAESADLIAACVAAIRPLSSAERVLLITAGRVGRLLPAGTPVSSSPLRRSDTASAPAPGSVGDPGTGTIVGSCLLDRAWPDGVPMPVDVLEMADDPAAAARLVDHRTAGNGRVGLLAIADGAAGHGDQAPTRRDDRSAAFDQAIGRALAAGDPAALRRACADRELARHLLALTDPLLALALLTAEDPPTVARLLYSGNPYGVGYLVASWRWTRR